MTKRVICCVVFVSLIEVLFVSSQALGLVSAVPHELPSSGICYDFQKERLDPLDQDPLLRSLGGLSWQKGQESTLGNYEYLQRDLGSMGMVRLSFPRHDGGVGFFLTQLLDHQKTKSSRVDPEDVVVKVLSTSPLREIHEVQFDIVPFPLVHISWKEQWDYWVRKGTWKSPQELMVRYQKTEGTQHIQQLCGFLNFQLSEKSEKILVTVGERAFATQRTPQDTLKGLIGTLKTLLVSTLSSNEMESFSWPQLVSLRQQ